MTPTQLLADWDAGKPVRLYAARGPGVEADPAKALLAAKVQMESLRLALGFKPAGSAKAKWNNLSGSTWTSHVSQAVAAAGAQALAAGDADNAANIGGLYFEHGVDPLVAPPHFTLSITKAGVLAP